MREELGWCIFRIAEAGGVLEIGDVRLLVHGLGDVIDDLGPKGPESLTDLSPRDWQQQVARSLLRHTGTLPDARTAEIVRNNLMRCYRQLWTAYDPRPWWQHVVWDPTLDARIPQRVHEPLGRRSVDFLRIRTGWLRAVLQWYDKVALDTGLLCWSTIATRLTGLAVFDAFLTERQISVPWLAGDPARVRALMLDDLGHVKTARVVAGPNRGRPLSCDHNSRPR
jgi:hypothetical protein